MTESVHIAGVGARTPVGLRAPAAAAAVRAGVSRLGEHPYMVDQVGDAMPAAMDSRLDPGFLGPKRLIAMAETALRESCEPLARWPQRIQVRAYVALPEVRPGFTDEHADEVRDGIARLDGLPVHISDIAVIPRGHAAGLLAFAAAFRDLRQGEVETCLVGGVDSYFDPDTMEWLDGNRQLVGSVSRSGFVPGEGAGFCLLMTDSGRRRLGLHSLARIETTATAQETKPIKTDAICLGEGLTAAVRDATAAARSRGGQIGNVICDMNSERYRGEEWGFVCLRLGRYFDDPTAYVAPARCWGDVGAASGPLFAMLACQAAERGWSNGRLTLLWASSEGGLRGAAVVETGTADARGVTGEWRGN